MEPSIALSHIVSTPDTCGGRPRVSGTRIRVQDIVLWHEVQGRSADEIVASFPQLTLAHVYSALAYYFDHREEIDLQLAADDAWFRSVALSTSNGEGKDGSPLSPR